MYKPKRVICWTIRPVLLRRPLGRVDIQALPPTAWCRRCGREVYGLGKDLCGECEDYG